MLSLLRTTSENPDFAALVIELDKELKVRDGDDHAFYAQFNKTDAIKHVVVATLNGQPVGCGAIKPFSDHAAEVKRMFVAPEFRGQGIAGQILKALETWAQELQFHHCVLETGLNQPEAIALYNKSGYARIPNYGQYIGVENSVCFEKQVS